MKFHPYSLLFPVADDRTLDNLADDIAENGLMEPITLYEDKILDGRCRYLACKLAGIEPVFRKYTGDEPLEFVFSRNYYRQHLNETQRAILGRAVYEKSRNCAIDKVTLDKVAAQVNVSKRQIQKTKYFELASDTIQAKAKSGGLSLHRVAEIVKQSAALTNIDPATKNAEERKRLHNTQDKILSLEEQ